MAISPQLQPDPASPSGITRHLLIATVRAFWIVWIIYLAIACYGWYRSEYIKLQPRTVTDAYRSAADNYWASKPLYIMVNPATGEAFEHGFLYPPHSAVAWTPFTLLSKATGGATWAKVTEEVIWRTLGAALLFCSVRALWRRAVLRDPLAPLPIWCGFTEDQLRHAPHLLIMGAVAMFCAGGSTMTGQVNSLIGAAFVFAGLALSQQRWWSTALWLALGLAFKPQMLPLIGVAAVLEWRASWRIALACAGVLALAWLNPDWSYDWSQHLAWREKMGITTREPGINADIAGLVQPIANWFGFSPTAGAYTPWRIIAAPLTLAACWFAWRRWVRPTTDIHHRAIGAVIVIVLCTGYVMLFNPRTEGNTYAVFGPPAGVILAIALRDRTWGFAAVLGVACLGLMFSRELAGVFAGDLRGVTNYWMRPLATIVVLVCLGLMQPRWWRARAAAIAPV